MDSSISCAVHAGWPEKQGKDLHRLFPADLHPSGTDIIRTWAYYLMVRHLALLDETPYKACLINGMVLGSDGRKMSKSLGNYIATTEVFQKYGADTSRQWAAGGGTTGSDIPFRWPDVEYAWRFLIKLWNASRFASMLLEDYEPMKPENAAKLTLLDRWILARMNKATLKVTEAFEKCQFNTAMEEIRQFAWHDLCDNFIEAAKHRLYRGEVYGQEKRSAAQYTLYTALYRLLQMLAPIAPHVTEEIYQTMFAAAMGHKSIHVSSWPRVDGHEVDEDAVRKGDLLVAVIGEIRREKAKKRMPLNLPVKELTIYAGTPENAATIVEFSEAIAGTCKVDKVSVLPHRGDGVGVEGYPDVRFVGL